MDIYVANDGEENLLWINQRDGTYVTMEEAGNGPGAVAMAEANPDGMHRGHDLWLTRLRELSENR